MHHVTFKLTCDHTLLQEDIYDVVADMPPAEVIDPVTGKTKLQPRARIPLFLPGRIIHITDGPVIKRYYYL